MFSVICYLLVKGRVHKIGMAFRQDYGLFTGILLGNPCIFFIEIILNLLYY